MPRDVVTIAWAEHEPPIRATTLNQLDEALDRIAAHCKPETPTIVQLDLKDQAVTLGLGAPYSVVQVARSLDPPYMITVGESSAQGVATFFFQAEHHTEIPKRNLIPISTAREIVREIFRTGQRPSTISWEIV